MTKNSYGVHEFPIEQLQQFIGIIRVQDSFIGEGKIDENYYLIKDERSATLFFHKKDFSIISHFYKTDLDEWFFEETISIVPNVLSQVDETKLKQKGLLK